MSQEPPEKMMFQLSLRRRGISDQTILRTMEQVPREVFVTAADRGHAYRDSALGIACGQTISQPFVVAYMTEQLQLQKQHKVLEIGTGSGYQAAILSRLCQHVLTVERYRTLADSARIRLEKLGYDNIEVLLGDGYDIPPGGGDFDRIMVTAAMEAMGAMGLSEEGGVERCWRDCRGSATSGRCSAPTSTPFRTRGRSRWSTTTATRDRWTTTSSPTASWSSPSPSVARTTSV